MRAGQIEKILAVMEGSRWAFGRFNGSQFYVCEVCASCGERKQDHKVCAYDEALDLLKRGHDEAYLEEQKPPKPATALTREDLERITSLGILTAYGVTHRGGTQALVAQQQDRLLKEWFPETEEQGQ